MPRLAVIAATDRTPRSTHVVGRAAAMARVLAARLIVAHVDDDADKAVAAARSGRTARSALGGIGRKLKTRIAASPAPRSLEAIEAEAHALDPDAVLFRLEGEPALALATLAKAENAALIVLGLHRERRVLDALRLTTMERIVAEVTTPVLIALQPPERAYRVVLALTDFSPGSAASLALAARLAPDARFHALHMLTLPLGARFSPDDPVCDAEITRAEQARDGFLNSPDLPTLAEAPLMVPGNLHSLLALYSGELGANLVCIGLNSGRDGYRLGHYARDLMRAPPVDLLIGRAS